MKHGSGSSTRLLSRSKKSLKYKSEKNLIDKKAIIQQQKTVTLLDPKDQLLRNAKNKFLCSRAFPAVDEVLQVLKNYNRDIQHCEMEDHPLSFLFYESLMICRELLNCWNAERLHPVALDSVTTRIQSQQETLDEYTRHYPQQLRGVLEKSTAMGWAKRRLTVHGNILESLNLLTETVKEFDLRHIVSTHVMHDGKHSDFLVGIANDKGLRTVHYRTKNDLQRSEWVKMFHHWEARNKVIDTLETMSVHDKIDLYSANIHFPYVTEELTSSTKNGNPKRDNSDEFLFAVCQTFRKSKTFNEKFQTKERGGTIGMFKKRLIEISMPEPKIIFYKKNNNTIEYQFTNEDIVDYRLRKPVQKDLDIAFQDSGRSDSVTIRRIQFERKEETSRFMSFLKEVIAYQTPMHHFIHHDLVSRLGEKAWSRANNMTIATSEEQEKWMFHYESSLNERAVIWEDKIGSVPPNVDIPQWLINKVISPKGMELVRKGIPERQRPDIWELMSGARKKRLNNPGLYHTTAARLVQKRNYNSVDKEIQKDVRRTMRSHTMFKTKKGLASMTRLLSVFAEQYPKIGYCQSMNVLAGNLLLIYREEEEKAYWMLDTLITDILPGDYYTTDLVGIHTDSGLLGLLLRNDNPALHGHLASYGLDISMICIQWFMCLFKDTLTQECILRVWDCLMVDGSIILFKVSLALLRLHTKPLLKFNDPAKIMTYLTNMGQLTYDCDLLMQTAYSVTGLSKEKFETLRDEFHVLEEEKAKETEKATQSRNQYRKTLRSSKSVPSIDKQLRFQDEKDNNSATLVKQNSKRCLKPSKSSPGLVLPPPLPTKVHSNVPSSHALSSGVKPPRPPSKPPSKTISKPPLKPGVPPPKPPPKTTTTTTTTTPTPSPPPRPTTTTPTPPPRPTTTTTTTTATEATSTTTTSSITETEKITELKSLTVKNNDPILARLGRGLTLDAVNMNNMRQVVRASIIARDETIRQSSNDSLALLSSSIIHEDQFLLQEEFLEQMADFTKTGEDTSSSGTY